MEHKPTWQTTLYNHQRNIMHISDMLEAAEMLGYSYICWNDCIYNISQHVKGGNHSCEDTGLTIEDVK